MSQPGTYKCALCGGVFEFGWTEEEAVAEMKKYFGAVPQDDREVVCDDCFKTIHPETHPAEVKAAKRAGDRSEGQNMLEKVYSLEEAQDWFIEHHTGAVICVSARGEEKECDRFSLAVAHFSQRAPSAPNNEAAQ